MDYAISGDISFNIAKSICEYCELHVKYSETSKHFQKVYLANMPPLIIIF